MSALLIVDVQHDFLPGGSLAVPDGDTVIPPILTLLRSRQWDLIAASQDFHPPAHISFASRHGEQPFQTKQLSDSKEYTLWPDHCVQGTAGTAIDETLLSELVQQPNFVLIRKGYDKEREEYSAFGGRLDVTGDRLQDLLTKASIKHLTICGLATDFCVAASARDARRLCPFLETTTVLREGVRGIDEERCAAFFEECDQIGVKVSHGD